jgi:DNA modification methylase
MTGDKGQVYTLDKSIGTDFITLQEAASLIGKSVHNVSYLINYKRINKYDYRGKKVDKVDKGRIYVSKAELLKYWTNWNEQLRIRRESVNVVGDELAFYHISEKERTKHIHRLHPYLGKFIPQLVEYYVAKNFNKDTIILDPFMGSATTLAVASELGMRSVGMDISEFNCIIAKAKLEDYDLSLVEKEITEIYLKTKEFSSRLDDGKLVSSESTKLNTNSDYLKKWFSTRALAELLFYRDSIHNYQYQGILKIILTRAARSSRLVHHYDIATPKKPVTEPYVCRKHQDKICTPIDRAIGKLHVYSFDTIKRLKEFASLRKTRDYVVVHGDSRMINLTEIVARKWMDVKVGGIFTSPPYVGQIDYHEQHRYAYELLEVPRYEEREVGAKRKGNGRKAQEEYQQGITTVFQNIIKALSPSAKVFIVANDKFNLYPKIITESGLKQIHVRDRPVEARTEGDKTPYSEKIFECILA